MIRSSMGRHSRDKGKGMNLIVKRNLQKRRHGQKDGGYSRFKALNFHDVFEYTYGLNG